MINPDTDQSSPEHIEHQDQPQWIVLHNDSVIGIFNSRDEANNAKAGYHLTYPLDLNSVLIIRQII